MNPEASFRFSHAVTRQPGKSVAHGIRDGAGPDPDSGAFLREHEAYVQALRATGAEVTVLEPLEDFPDSVFVEDPALCVAGAAIILRPGAESRFGERDPMRRALDEIFTRVIDLPEGGFVDGGDILVTGREVLIGLSARTDEAGVAQLDRILAELGVPLRIVQTPPEILHFKTGCGLLDAETIFATAPLVRSGCFDGYEVVECPEGEEPAANLIRVNDTVFLAKGFPRTAALLREKGYAVTELSVAEAAKLDGGLSCMSLRFTPDPSS
ncbi:dimethylarginine dimethylaminohydrolase [Hwanghaeella grinnelliae]|uniref:Dimethylarginine dimethylaminohydrolase n=1 Tax=Hwanghaeella grinnelliae TaxID=2500179 RepID=A0A437QN37_9PROT|nr:arginine deiminase family protein [Hwanghaeella grinnelliae]RVU35951.1 dimethylarginine dimethylaminohydrolase [Hwanghaeella grinnelliae]